MAKQRVLFELGDVTPSRYFLTLALVLGLILGLVSANEDVQIFIHLIQWQVQSVFAVATLCWSHTVCSRRSILQQWSVWLGLVFTGILGSVIIMPGFLAIDILVGQNRVEDVRSAFFSQLGEEFLGLAPPITLTWLLMNAPFVLGYQLKFADRAADNDSSGSVLLRKGETEISTLPESEFLSLPEFPPGKLIVLKSELHYLDVITTQGKSLILFSLKDAVAQLAHLNGFQCHRSYWVNGEFVIGMRTKGRQAILLLGNGTEVPVSRNRVASTRAWFESLQE